MWVRTFHSACVRILRKETDKFGYKSNFSIYDAAGPEAADDAGRPTTSTSTRGASSPARCCTGSPTTRTSCATPRRPPADARNKLEETYAAAYTLYQRRLREANALDFDDLIMSTVHLFQTFPEVRETYRRRFRHVLVDEYQDTNHAQYALIHQLCADEPRGVGRRRSGSSRPS